MAARPRVDGSRTPARRRPRRISSVSRRAIRKYTGKSGRRWSWSAADRVSSAVVNRSGQDPEAREDPEDREDRSIWTRILSRSGPFSQSTVLAAWRDGKALQDLPNQAAQ